MRDSRDRANTQIDYNDYEEILKKYRNQPQNSITSTQLESILEDDVPSNFSFDQMEQDTKKNQNLQKSNDVDFINQNDSIFQSTLSVDKLKELKQGKNECCICHKSNKIISQLKQCKYCGNVICKEHGKKKRKDPKNPAKFRRLCDICEDKYIRLSIETTFREKRNFLAQQALELDSQSQQLLQEIRSLQNQVSEIQQKSVKQQGEYKQIQHELIFKIKKLDDETISFQEENLKLKQTIQIIKKELQFLNEKLAEKKLDTHKKQQLLHQIDQEIQFNDLECQKMILEIDKLQLTIQSKKKQKDFQQQSKTQVQKTDQNNYQQYILPDDSPTIQQFNPYLNANNNLNINNNQNSETETDVQVKQKTKSKKDTKEKEQENCCSIM